MVKRGTDEMKNSIARRLMCLCLIMCRSAGGRNTHM